MNIIGISCFYHDAAACLLKDGVIIAAAQEERFSRKKHDSSFPQLALEYCLNEGKITAQEVDIVAFYDKPFLKFERILESYLHTVPKGLLSAWKALPIWIKEKLWISEQIKDFFGESCTYLFPEHHESHAASAFYPSPYQNAAVLTMDGVGEWATSSFGSGNGNKLELTHQLDFPHSLGLLYSAFTYYTGFKVNSGEYKVMGLAPYGKPRFTQAILEHLIDIKEDGSFKMNMDYFDYIAGLKMTSSKFDRIFGGPPRKAESKLTQREMDLAASVQAVTEEIVLKMGRNVRKVTGEKAVCLAGGVALNCVANGKLRKENIFDSIWVQPAAGDAGGAIGAAFLAYHSYLERPRISKPSSAPKNFFDRMQGSYLGPSFSNQSIQTFLESKQAIFREAPSQEELLEVVANTLANEKVVGWFQGRMEFGPRALGNRSILGDPRSEQMQKTLNLKIKFRESFRPFAPSVLSEKVGSYFDFDDVSPYMLMVDRVHPSIQFETDSDIEGIQKLYQKRSELPAITHVDYSARIQTVHKETNPLYHALISKFEALTGCAVLINTSFNVRGEPIVCTPEDAYRCFMRTNMDCLVLGNFILFKSDQPDWVELEDWQSEFELD